MIYQNLSLIAAFLLFYSLFAGRIESRLVNGPLMFLLAGLVLGPVVMDVLQMSLTSSKLRVVAELTLAVVLFTDAANANMGILRTYNRFPLRLLLIGLPLCLFAGWGFCLLLFPDMPWLEAAILATMLAPTDAALGKAVVTNPDVPAPVREALNVESGLNDGICVPVLFILLALLVPEQMHQGTLEMALELVAEEIGIGLIVGLSLAACTSLLLRYSNKYQFSLPLWRQLTMPSLALLSFALTQYLGGSGFIAAFVCGLLTGYLLKEHKHHYLESNEGYGELLSVIVWMAFGAVVIATAWPYLTWRSWVYAIVSLTFLRMIPVWISLMGSTLNTELRLFIGWFGPRGLASIVFAVIVMDRALPSQHTILPTVVCTILLSVILHGLTANPWVARLKRQSSV